MNILVCAKQVLDPEGVNSYALWGRLSVDESGRNFDTGGTIPHIVNAYDEQALEAALRIRDTGVDCSITVATVGAKDAKTMLRRGVAMGADHAIEVSSNESGTDGFQTAMIIANLVRELRNIDLVICGRQGSDFDQGTVPAALAEHLDWPYVTMASNVSIEGDALRVTRVTPRGEEIVETKTSTVVAVSNEIGQTRYPSSRLMMAARRMEHQVMDVSELLSEQFEGGVELIKLFVPELQGQCVVLDGDSPEAKAALLLNHLAEAGVLDG
tara:strand:- start:3886 stop:4692 length:807 start_codon:yes stop_codon:yes gene_type:complete